MSIINLRSYEPVLDFVLPQFEKVLNKQVEINWNFEKKRQELSTKELMVLFVEDVDFVLIAQSKVAFHLPERIKVDCILRSEDGQENYLILSLKEHAYDFSAIDRRSKYGKVHIVGFGPGNPDLLTIKAQRLLEKADVILYDDLIDNSYIDQFTSEKIYVGKRKGKHSLKQEEINDRLYQQAIRGKQVVRIKGGDPLVFGRGSEEYHFLKQRFVEAEIVPGVTSALAAASDAIIPLTSRGVSTSVAFALGHDADNNKLPKADTLVFYMGAAQQKAWAKRLIKEGWSANTPVAAVRNASLPDRAIKRYTLGQLKKEDDVLPAPSLVIVGHTATSDIKSLGQKWLYTGSDVNDFKKKGIVIHNPMISVQSLNLEEKTLSILDKLQQYERIVFASPYAVKEFFKALITMGKDVRAIYNADISSIGNSTSAELKKYGLRVTPSSDQNSVKALVKSIVDSAKAKENILLPCAVDGFVKLGNELETKGNQVQRLELYKNVLPKTAVRHNLDEFYGVVFTSPTTVKNFFKFYGDFPSKLKVQLRGDYTKTLFEEMLQKVSTS